MLRRLAMIGASPEDARDEALRKETLVLAAVLITALAVVWVVAYSVLGLYLSAAIPFAYQFVSVVNLTPSFEFKERGVIEIKGKGTQRTYLLIGPKDEIGLVPVVSKRESVSGSTRGSESSVE